MHSRIARSPASFRSVKSSAPVPVSSALRLDVLVQSALDPSVDEIDYVQCAVISGCRIRLDLPVIVRKRARFAIDIVDDHPLRSVDDEGLSLLAVQDLGLELIELRRTDIHRDPVTDNARLVWRHTDQEVRFDEEIAALEALSERNFTIDQLTQLTGVSVETIFALACADLVVVDLMASRFCADATVCVSPRHRQRKPALFLAFARNMEASR
jgi:hypothetical protein